MPHRVLERDVKLNLGRFLITLAWGAATVLVVAAWIVENSDHSRLLGQTAMMSALLAVAVGQLKSNLRQRSMCAARLDLAEVRRTGEPLRGVQ